MKHLLCEELNEKFGGRAPMATSCRSALGRGREVVLRSEHRWGIIMAKALLTNDVEARVIPQSHVLVP